MLTSVEKTACIDGIFKRLNYFHGLLLTEEDFVVEQRYLREKAKLHNRLHGHGVVWGLGLSSICIRESENSVYKIVIEPGFALDCAGNEILICQQHRVDIEGKISELCRRCETLWPPPKLFVGIEYCECKSNPEAKHLTLRCEGDVQPAQFSRVREGYTVRIFTEDELPDCSKPVTAPVTARDKDGNKRDKQNCLGLSACCGDQCVVILGCMQNYLSEEKWAEECQNIAKHPFPPEYIDPCYQPPSVHTGHSRAYTQWEQQKQRVLHTACETFQWVALAAVISQSEEAAWKYVEDNGLRKGSSLKIGDIEEAARPALMERIDKAISCVARGSTIDLLIDQHDCVLFALPRDGGEQVGQENSSDSEVRS